MLLISVTTSRVGLGMLTQLGCYESSMGSNLSLVGANAGKYATVTFKKAWKRRPD